MPRETCSCGAIISGSRSFVRQHLATCDGEPNEDRPGSNHNAGSTGEESNAHACTYCQQDFDTGSDYLSHLQDSHGVEVPEGPNE